LVEHFHGKEGVNGSSPLEGFASLGFLRELPHLLVLSLEAHDKDFDAAVAMHFGGIRDLSPLAELPRLPGLELYQIRKLAPTTSTHSAIAVHLRLKV
jgi:hypothetical protein